MGVAVGGDLKFYAVCCSRIAWVGLCSPTRPHVRYLLCVADQNGNKNLCSSCCS